MTPHASNHAEPHRTKAARAAAVAVGALLLIAPSCSNTDEAHTSAPPQTQATPTTTTPAAAPGSTVVPSDTATPTPTPAATVPTTAAQAFIDVTNQPGTGEFVGAADDTELQRCEGGDGRWTATGTAINPTDANVDYRIYVSFLDTAGETLALVETDLGNVAPNTPVEWTADSPISANGLHCVLRTERHTRSSS